MRPFLLLFLAVSLPAHAQAVAPMPAPVPVRPPPVMTPGYFPGSQGNPVYTPTGAGLPGERVPGTVAPPVPTSKGRILPREPDGAPGLWAADGVHRASAEDRADVFGVTIPYPEDAEEAARRMVDGCSASLARASYETRQEAYLSGLPLAVRQCLAYSAYEMCVREMRRQLAPTPFALSSLPDVVRELFVEALEHASGLTTRYCTPGLVERAANAAFRKVADEWIATSRRPTPLGN